jgi:hypothetical protein
VSLRQQPGLEHRLALLRHTRHTRHTCAHHTPQDVRPVVCQARVRAHARCCPAHHSACPARPPSTPATPPRPSGHTRAHHPPSCWPQCPLCPPACPLSHPAGSAQTAPRESCGAPRPHPGAQPGRPGCLCVRVCEGEGEGGTRDTVCQAQRGTTRR